jgi:cytochrome P450
MPPEPDPLTPPTPPPSTPGAMAMPPGMLQSFLADPYPALAFIRATAPVFREPNIDAWFVTREQDVDAMLRSPLYGKDPRKATSGRPLQRVLNPDPDQEPSMLVLDPPDHTRLRGLVNKAFTPRAVEQLRPRVQQTVDQLLDAVAGKPGFDVMEALADPLPITIIAEMIGVDVSQQAQFRRWSHEIAAALDAMATPEVIETARAARAGLSAYFAQEIAEHRARPREDLISGLIAAQEGSDVLSDYEMTGILILLLIAGNVTTTDLIGNCVLALCQRPDQLRKLQADPSLIGATIEETLRYDSPVLGTSRIPLQDVEVSGCPIPAHDTVVVSIAGANRDPAVTPDPERFDITRPEIRHHAFGGGPHYCLGAPLARLEGQIAIGTLVRRFPHLRLDPARPPERRLLPAFHGLISLQVLISEP